VPVNPADLTSPLVITAGEPAGIGPDLCLALAQTEWAQKIVVITDPDVLQHRAKRLGQEISIVEFEPTQAHDPSLAAGALRVWPHPLENPGVCGVPDPANASGLLVGLRMAVSACQNGIFGGMVTAPLQKSTINDGGITFSGHTEYLADLTNTTTPVMLLVGGGLRVALASTHMPLSKVPTYVTAERLTLVIDVLHNGLKTLFAIDDPEIVVCGMNPHAGENRHLGSEDQDIIAPVIEEFRQRQFNVRGPLPADTAFTPAAGHADAVLAMYHDQGLPVLKYAAFGKAVNVTLGLPIVRTSVDHGTALDIAGTGAAKTGSMLAAIELAAKLASR